MTGDALFVAGSAIATVLALILPIGAEPTRPWAGLLRWWRGWRYPGRHADDASWPAWTDDDKDQDQAEFTGRYPATLPPLAAPTSVPCECGLYDGLHWQDCPRDPANQQPMVPARPVFRVPVSDTVIDLRPYPGWVQDLLGAASVDEFLAAVAQHVTEAAA